MARKKKTEETEVVKTKPKKAAKKTTKKQTKTKKEPKLVTTEPVMLEEESDDGGLNEQMMDDFATKIEAAINKVCDKWSGVDPRMELVVTLALSVTQVAIDTGYDKDDFLSMLNDMFNDFSECENCSHHEHVEVETDKNSIN